MRRFIVFLVLLVVPLQFAWAAVANLHGHVGDDAAHVLEAHAHDADHADHPHNARWHHDHAPSDPSAPTQGEDGQHGCHYHPVFTSLPMEPCLKLGFTLRSAPLPHPSAAFLSRTPPPLDRPPLARA